MTQKSFHFDLQQFAEVKKTKQLSNAVIDELSLVFKNYDGKEWAPRNQDAVVLTTKAGEKPPAQPTFLERFAQTVKGWYVKDDVADDIDNDGDGAEDYEQILMLITGMSYDLQSAMWMSDDDMRSAAIVAGIQAFLSRLDDVRSGGDGARKAGAKHSKATKEHIDAMSTAHKTMGEHLKALGADTDEADDADKAAAIAAAGTAPPAAITPPAATPPAITPPTDASKAGETDEMKPEQIQAMIDKAVSSAVTKTAEAFTAQAAKAKADADAAIAKAQADADTAKKAAEEAQKALGAAVVDARKATGTSASQPSSGEPTRLQLAVKAALAASPQSTRF